MSKKLFDYVIGNPPYQEETSEGSELNNQKSQKNVFQYMQETADLITKNTSCLIYPGGRWIHRSGKGMETFGKDQINSPHLSHVTFYRNPNEIFDHVAIADGVTIVVKNNQKTEPGFEYEYKDGNIDMTVHADCPGDMLMPLNPYDLSICDKVHHFVRNNQLEYLHDHILPRSLFRIESDFVQKNPQSVRPYTTDANVDFATEIKLFTNDKAGKTGRAKWFVANKSVITHNQSYIAQWQVVVSSANAGGQKRDNQIEVIDDHSAFGRSRVALRSFSTQKEAQNFMAYCQTDLIRFMFLMTDENLTSLAKRVPDVLNYTDDNTLIDFHQNIERQLEKLVGLTTDEISYIHERISSLRKHSESEEAQ